MRRNVHCLPRTLRAPAVALFTWMILSTPLLAEAQSSFYPAFTGTVTVGVPAPVPMVIPLELNATMLANLPSSTVVYSTTDPATIFALSTLGSFAADGVITSGELIANYPGAKITIHGFTATLSGDARFSLDASACAAPAGTTCTANANFSGAVPAGPATLKMVGTGLSFTLSGTGNGFLESLINGLGSAALSMFNQFLVFDLQVTVAKAGQSITFGTAPASIVVGIAGAVSATGGVSGNPVTFSSTTTGICSVSGATVSGLAAGTCTIAANQAGNTNYNAAPQVTQSFAIGKGSQTVAFGTAPTVVVGTSGSLSATATSGLGVVFTSTTLGTCSVSGATVLGVSAGTCTIAGNQAGNTNYNAAPQVTQSFAIGKASQSIAFGPAPTVFVGTSGTVSATATSGLGVVFTSTTTGTCSVSGASASGLAAGTCTIAANQAGSTNYNAAPQATQSFAVVPATSIPRLANISTRMQVLTGNDVMIAGFIIGGTASKTVVVNVAGPNLANFGIASPLPNPKLTLVRAADGVIVDSNDDWQVQDAAKIAALLASGFQPNNAVEPAIIATLAPGAYTAIVQGAGTTTGVGLVGVFEVDHPETPLINISTRGQVLTGNDVMIAGFIIQGDTSRRVVVNVAGPNLASYGITNALADPTLILVRASDNTVLATNDDWQVQLNPGDVAAIQATGFQPNQPKEPAIIATLPPGAYTAIVQGVGGPGVGLVGVFIAP